jgi:hypothetical protein
MSFSKEGIDPYEALAEVIIIIKKQSNYKVEIGENFRATIIRLNASY